MLVQQNLKCSSYKYTVYCHINLKKYIFFDDFDKKNSNINETQKKIKIKFRNRLKKKYNTNIIVRQF